MVTSLKLDVKTWDIGLDGSGNIASLQGKMRVAQDVATSVRLFKNDAYFAKSDGIPYWQDVLVSQPQASLIRSHIRRQALKVPNVVAVDSITFDALIARKLTGDITVRDNLPDEPVNQVRPDNSVDNFYAVENVYGLKNVYRIRITG